MHRPLPIPTVREAVVTVRQPRTDREETLQANPHPVPQDP